MARLQVLVVLKIQSDSIKDISLICKLPFLYQRRKNFSLFHNETHRSLMTKSRSGKGKVGGGGG